LIVMGGVLCLMTKASFLAAELLVYAPPLVYLVARSEVVRGSLDLRFLAKATVFCAIFYTYVGVRYNGWTSPSALPRPLGVPVEQALWGAMVIPLSVAVNQRFFAKRRDGRPLARSRTLVYSLFLIGLAIAVIPPLRSLMDGFVYLKIGLIIYPLVFALAFRLGRSIWLEIVLTGLVFFIVHTGFELLAMRRDYWGFRGDYVGWVSLFHERIPLEELVFILALSSPCVVAVNALRCNWKQIPTRGRPG
jgi:hypothetical protein